jgi:hypothetical protein
MARGISLFEGPRRACERCGQAYHRRPANVYTASARALRVRHVQSQCRLMFGATRFDGSVLFISLLYARQIRP